IILYAPTFRERESAVRLAPAFWRELSAALDPAHTVLVNLHPNDRQSSIPAGLNNVVDISGRGLDIQEVMRVADLLITDYSSIATDFVLTQKPFLIFGYDYDDYKKTSRDLYYAIEEVFQIPILKTAEELIACMRARPWHDSESYQRQYRRFALEFNQYFDGMSTSRVVDAMDQLA
ncbi:MAG: hypothetical protein EOO23_08945, partial [Comamonadaceae bacterium]